jgi:hypothetical protein
MFPSNALSACQRHVARGRGRRRPVDEAPPRRPPVPRHEEVERWS